jgi:hypothetical protein
VYGKYAIKIFATVNGFPDGIGIQRFRVYIKK